MNFTKQRYRLLSHVFWGRKKQDYRNKYLRYKQQPKEAGPVSPETTPVQLDENVLHIAIAEGGGLGDALIQLPYIKQIRKLFDKPVQIDFYCKAYAAFQDVPFIDHCYAYSKQHPTYLYDVYLISRRLYMLCKFDEEKVKLFSLPFYDFCKHNQYITEVVFEGKYSDNAVTQYASLFNKNRMEQADIHGLLPVTRNTPSYLSWREDAFAVLKKFGLDDIPYITICRAVDNKYVVHTKLWLMSYYNELVTQLKSKYPHIKIVQVGSSHAYGDITGVDLNIVGKTSLDQIKVILKYALLHIDGEGGLVHLRHLLNQKSVVLFGPTSPAVFGYDNNINLRSNICPPCSHILPNWHKKCPRGGGSPFCMQMLKPGTVFQEVSKFLDVLPHYQYIKKDADSIRFKREMKIAYIGKFSFPWKLDEILDSGAELIVYKNTPAAFSEPLPGKSAPGSEIVSEEYSTPYNIAAEDESFDLVFNTDVSRLNYPFYALKESMRVLKEGGIWVGFNPTKQWDFLQRAGVKNIKGTEELIAVQKRRVA